jgi:hypothetical protein
MAESEPILNVPRAVVVAAAHAGFLICASFDSGLTVFSIPF